MKEPKVMFFWGHTQKDKSKIDKSCLSNWYPCHFTEPIKEDDPTYSVHYYSTEQYIMAHKAILFGDKESFSKIVREKDPAKVKKLGREVTGFDQATWDAYKWQIAANGIYLKFSQNEELKKFLVDTGDETALIEASPYDKIWGIGFAQDKAMEHLDQWGENVLGKVLMIVRSRLIDGETMLDSDKFQGNEYEKIDNIFWKIVGTRNYADSHNISIEEAETIIDSLAEDISKSKHIDINNEEDLDMLVTNVFMKLLKDGGVAITEETIDKLVDSSVAPEYREIIKKAIKCHQNETKQGGAS